MEPSESWSIDKYQELKIKLNSLQYTHPVSYESSVLVHHLLEDVLKSVQNFQILSTKYETVEAELEEIKKENDHIKSHDSFRKNWANEIEKLETTVSTLELRLKQSQKQAQSIEYENEQLKKKLETQCRSNELHFQSASYDHSEPTLKTILKDKEWIIAHQQKQIDFLNHEYQTIKLEKEAAFTHTSSTTSLQTSGAAIEKCTQCSILTSDCIPVSKQDATDTIMKLQVQLSNYEARQEKISSEILLWSKHSIKQQEVIAQLHEKLKVSQMNFEHSASQYQKTYIDLCNCQTNYQKLLKNFENMTDDQSSTKDLNSAYLSVFECFFVDFEECIEKCFEFVNFLRKQIYENLKIDSSNVPALNIVLKNRFNYVDALKQFKNLNADASWLNRVRDLKEFSVQLLNSLNAIHGHFTSCMQNTQESCREIETLRKNIAILDRERDKLKLELDTKDLKLEKLLQRQKEPRLNVSSTPTSKKKIAAQIPNLENVHFFETTQLELQNMKQKYEKLKQNTDQFIKESYEIQSQRDSALLSLIESRQQFEEQEKVLHESLTKIEDLEKVILNYKYKQDAKIIQNQDSKSLKDAGLTAEILEYFHDTLAYPEEEKINRDRYLAMLNTYCADLREQLTQKKISDVTSPSHALPLDVSMDSTSSHLKKSL